MASAYGSLRATESLPVDKTATLQVERVQFRQGESISLSRLLELLPDADIAETNAYDRFREHNPHFLLPERPENQSGVPPRGNVQLVSRAGTTPVRFFPAGRLDPKPCLLRVSTASIRKKPSASGRIRMAEPLGPTIAHPIHPRAFSATVWDRRYDELVQEIARFGFTNENRERLAALAERFEALAREQPSFYRDMQLKIIRTHHRLWHSEVFDRLAAVVRATGISEEGESDN